MLTSDALRELAVAESERFMVSVHARTDPRDPANTSVTPGWLIELRNGLREAAERIEASGEREDRLGFRALRERIESELVELSPAERARSVSWFIDADGRSDRYSLRLPLRGDHVVLDSRPFISPLADVVDRGAPTGIVLAGSDLVRLVAIEQGEVTEPEDSSFELTFGDWRPFGGTAGGSSERGVTTTSHQEAYRARVDEHRERLFDTAATETTKRLRTLGWERIVLVMERAIASRFRSRLTPELAERVVAEADLNLLRSDAAAIAEAMEPHIEAAWLAETGALVQAADGRARAGGAATLGASQTLGALAEGRVHHLVLDPDHDFSAVAGTLPPPLDAESALIAERAIEAAVRTEARVSALACSQSDALTAAGGIVALLRY